MLIQKCTYETEVIWEIKDKNERKRLNRKLIDESVEDEDPIPETKEISKSTFKHNNHLLIPFYEFTKPE
jgi:hypothetical protein